MVDYISMALIPICGVSKVGKINFADIEIHFIYNIWSGHRLSLQRSTRCVF